MSACDRLEDSSYNGENASDDGRSLKDRQTTRRVVVGTAAATTAHSLSQRQHPLPEHYLTVADFVRHKMDIFQRHPRQSLQACSFIVSRQPRKADIVIRAVLLRKHEIPARMNKKRVPQRPIVRKSDRCLCCNKSSSRSLLLTSLALDNIPHRVRASAPPLTLTVAAVVQHTKVPHEGSGKDGLDVASRHQ